MNVGAILSPVAEWDAVADAARVADDAGIDSIGFWDHYHSLRPEWGYICSWSAYGWLAAITSRVRLVPMVLNALHYELGVLAKESSVLAIASGGRFELGIGAGDWPESFAAWGVPYPDRETRMAMLEEKVAALRALWRGDPVTTAGEHVTLDGATCTPAPATPPRVVVGVGGSRRMLGRALAYADEVNVYADTDLVHDAVAAAASAGRPVDVSVFLGWEFDKWPADPHGELERWSEVGATRALVNVGGDGMPDRIRTLAATAVT